MNLELGSRAERALSPFDATGQLTTDNDDNAGAAGKQIWNY